MKKQLLLSAVLAAAFAAGFALAPAAAFADDMTKNGMSHFSKMSSDRMEKSSRMDSMSKTSGAGMHKDDMKKNGMSGDDKMKDGMDE
ncbi:MAG: hypothetical protein WA792_02675 [Pseudolabrys sp.]